MPTNSPKPSRSFWDLWACLHVLAFSVITLPNSLIRLFPILKDLFVLTKTYPLESLIHHHIPQYFTAIGTLDAMAPYKIAGCLGLMMVHGWVAGRALHILLIRLVVRLGFRVEASSDSVLLHPEEVAP